MGLPEPGCEEETYSKCGYEIVVFRWPHICPVVSVTGFQTRFVSMLFVHNREVYRSDAKITTNCWRLSPRTLTGTSRKMHGTVYGMKKTTVYLPDGLKAALERSARVSGRSEAALIREAIEDMTRKQEAPGPRLPLFSSGEPGLAENADRELAGFGER